MKRFTQADLHGMRYKDQCEPFDPDKMQKWKENTLPVKTPFKPDYFPEYMCRAANIPLPKLEYRFHTVRLWRFDAAWPEPHKVACEVEGGIWINGGHNRGQIYSDNMEKYNAAQLLGWIVLRYEPTKINFVQIREALVFRGYSW